MHQFRTVMSLCKGMTIKITSEHCRLELEKERSIVLSTYIPLSSFLVDLIILVFIFYCRMNNYILRSFLFKI